MNSAEKKKLGDAFGGLRMTQCSIKMEHDLLLGVSFKFHVIRDNVKLPADGVLGRDNMWSRSIFNLCKNELVFIDKSERDVLKYP